jgi:hypothetical protein
MSGVEIVAMLGGLRAKSGKGIQATIAYYVMRRELS